MLLDPRNICHKCEFVEKEWKPPRRNCMIDGENISGKKICLKGFFTSPTHNQIRDHSKCTFRGAEVSREQCDECGGVVMLKIFSCPVHSRCAIGKAPEGVMSCAGCADYRAVTV